LKSLGVAEGYLTGQHVLSAESLAAGMMKSRVQRERETNVNLAPKLQPIEARLAREEMNRPQGASQGLTGSGNGFAPSVWQVSNFASLWAEWICHDSNVFPPRGSAKENFDPAAWQGLKRLV